MDHEEPLRAIENIVRKIKKLSHREKAMMESMAHTVQEVPRHVEKNEAGDGSTYAMDLSQFNMKLEILFQLLGSLTPVRPTVTQCEAPLSVRSASVVEPMAFPELLWGDAWATGLAEVLELFWGEAWGIAGNC